MARFGWGPDELAAPIEKPPRGGAVSALVKLIVASLAAALIPLAPVVGAGRDVILTVGGQNLSPRSTFIVAQGSGHDVQVDRPQVVVDAVRRIAGAAGGNP
jgi:hypothetical protein